MLQGQEAPIADILLEQTLIGIKTFCSHLAHPQEFWEFWKANTLANEITAMDSVIADIEKNRNGV